MRLIVRLLLALVVATGTLAGAVAQQEHLVTRIAFGSCADEEKPQPIWDAVLAYKPDLFLFLGDNVYGDERGGKELPRAQALDGLRHAYATARNVPGFMAVKNGVRHLATWDDHDYGANDGGAEFAGKREAQKLFLEFWNIARDDPRHTRDGVYHAQIFGRAHMRVQVILLDTRFFRSPLKDTDRRAPGKERYVPDSDPGKTMLGEAQWAWLGERLREPAELRLIVSSIQVLAEGHGWERWGNLPRERQRLFDLIRDSQAGGVVFLSGDRHIGAIYRETAGVPYPLVEVTASGINQTFVTNREPGPNRLGAVYGAENFGTIDVDWWEGRLTLSLRGMNGEPVRRHAVAIDELRRK
jgi:alkaline phosphatase D